MSKENNRWRPPEFVSREQCIKDTEEVLGLPDIAIKSSEDIFRINVLGVDWDMGLVVHQPVDASKIPTGADVKPVPPFLFEISKDSRDHSPEVYNEVILLGFRAMKPAPKVAITRFGAGVHSFWKPEKD